MRHYQEYDNHFIILIIFKSQDLTSSPAIWTLKYHGQIGLSLFITSGNI